MFYDFTVLTRMWVLINCSLQMGIEQFNSYCSFEWESIPLVTSSSFTVVAIPLTEYLWFKPFLVGIFVLLICLSIYAVVTKRQLIKYVKNLEEIVEIRTAALQESEKLYRAAIEVADAVPYYQNYLTNSYEFVGARIKDLTGYSADEFNVDVWLSLEYEIVLLGNLKGMSIDEAVQKARGEEGVSWRADYRIITRDGVEKWLANAAIQVRDEEGNVVGSLGILQDITDRKRSEQEKEKLETQLRQSSKMEAVGQLAGGVAHDFNNLLTAVIGNLSLVESKVSEDKRRFLLSARNAAERAAELVQQLLAFSRKSQVALKTIDLNRIASEVSQLARETIDRRIDIRLIEGDDLPNIRGDVGQLNTILMNLFVNSRDAILDIINGKIYPERRNDPFVITVQTTTQLLDVDHCNQHPEAQQGNYVVLTVSDNGKGMEPAICEHVFEPFYTTKDIGKGTGLGLASVYGIAKQHKGWIELQSEAGIGTTFSVYFPVDQTDGEKQAEDRQEPLRGGKENLLLIDDEEMILDLGRTILERHGYHVFTASDGNQGLSVYRQNRNEIQLIILDLSMPFLSGREFLEKLREIDTDVKVIVSSGYSEKDDLEQLVYLNVAEYVQKPYRPSEMIRQIRKVLDSNTIDSNVQ